MGGSFLGEERGGWSGFCHERGRSEQYFFKKEGSSVLSVQELRLLGGWHTPSWIHADEELASFAAAANAR